MVVASIVSPASALPPKGTGTTFGGVFLPVLVLVLVLVLLRVRVLVLLRVRVRCDE